MSEGSHDDFLTLAPNTPRPSPDTLSRLIKRVHLLTMKLLPVEVPIPSIRDPTSRVITPQVLDAYIRAAGDFKDALPYCLLRAYKEFHWEADNNQADFGENTCRAIACEVLARYVVHLAEPQEMTYILSARFKHKEHDGRLSENISALELAIDSHCTIFLSSSEAQDVVNDLWRGKLVQNHSENDELEFVPYTRRCNSFWDHIDPSRLSVPSYLNIFHIVVWIIFLVTYSQAVREPLDKLDPEHENLDMWEVVMYVLALSFSFEDLHKIYQLIVVGSYRALGFWHFASIATDSLLLAAFMLRMWGIAEENDTRSLMLRTYSFQCLSFVAPLIWMKLIPIFDGFKFVGTMQICVARMLKESGFFFGLLVLLGAGFMQGLYALDASDGHADHPHEVIHVLVQALLQSPDYDMFSGSTAGQILYYLWNVATALILLNVLISLFSSAYNDVVEDAPAEYLTYFAGKVVGMLRAPDDYAYPAPFNLVETFLIAPLEFMVSKKVYATINRYVMLVLFFVPLVAIALWESELDPDKNRWVKDWFAQTDEDIEGPSEFNPEPGAEDAARGLQISKVPFDELVKALPDTTHSSEATITKEVRELKEQIEELKRLLLERAL